MFFSEIDSLVNSYNSPTRSISCKMYPKYNARPLCDAF